MNDGKQIDLSIIERFRVASDLKWREFYPPLGAELGMSAWTLHAAARGRRRPNARNRHKMERWIEENAARIGAIIGKEK